MTASKRFCDSDINNLSPRKRKIAPGNKMPFKTNYPPKAIMKRSRLRHNFLNNRTGRGTNKTLYTKQKNYYVSPLKKSKKKYFAKLNEKYMLDNKFVWKTIKPSYREKIMTRDGINLSGKGELVKIELETAEVLIKLFSNIVNTFEIPNTKYLKYESFIDNIQDQTLRQILKYKNHPSIMAIQNKFKGGDVFFISEKSEKGKYRKKSVTEIVKRSR